MPLNNVFVIHLLFGIAAAKSLDCITHSKMSRPYCEGLHSYARQHRIPDQECRHKLAVMVLEAANANERLYAQHDEQINYRMGSFETNRHVDIPIDNGIVNVIQSRDPHAYNASELAHRHQYPIAHQQQYEHLRTRFQAAREFFDATHDRAYVTIMSAIRAIAGECLNGDMREWRIPGH